MDCLEVTGLASHKELYSFETAFDALAAYSSFADVCYLQSFGFYKMVNPFAFTPTEEIVPFIDIYDASARSTMLAFNETLGRVVHLRLLVNSLYSLESLNGDTLNINSFFQELQTDLMNVNSAYLLPVQSLLYVGFVLMILLSLVLLFIYIPISSIIYKIIIGLSIFLGSAGFIFLMIPDFSVFGILIVIIYCSAIAILIVIAFFLLRSKIGGDLQNPAVSKIIFVISIIGSVSFSLYIGYLIFLNSDMLNSISTELYIKARIVEYIIAKIDYFHVTESFFSGTNFYSRFGFYTTHLVNS